jgi:hypothetical protein
VIFFVLFDEMPCFVIIVYVLAFGDLPLNVLFTTFFIWLNDAVKKLLLLNFFSYSIAFAVADIVLYSKDGAEGRDVNAAPSEDEVLCWMAVGSVAQIANMEKSFDGDFSTTEIAQISFQVLSAVRAGRSYGVEAAERAILANLNTPVK